MGNKVACPINQLADLGKTKHSLSRSSHTLSPASHLPPSGREDVSNTAVSGVPAAQQTPRPSRPVDAQPSLIRGHASGIMQAPQLQPPAQLDLSPEWHGRQVNLQTSLCTPEQPEAADADTGSHVTHDQQINK